MKPVGIRRIATALVIAGASAVLVGCGSTSNTTPATVLPGVGTNGILGSGGCAPITGAIPFTGQGIYFSYSSIVGGYVPGSTQPVGQVVIGGGSGGGQFQRTAVDLTISMSIIPAAMQYSGTYPPGYPSSIYPGTIPQGYQYPSTSGIAGYNQFAGFGQNPGLANATGYITINPADQQQLMLQFGTGYGSGGYGSIPGYPGGYPGYPTSGYPGYPTTGVPGSVGQVPCVSSIAFNLGNYDGTLYGGFVWLYLNGTQHGVYYPI